MADMLRVLTLSTLFPDASRPVFGPFVERQTLGLAAHPEVELQVVAPIGLPPGPLSRFPRYRGFRDVPSQEDWKGLTVHRPRFWHIPGMGGAFDAGMEARAILPLLRRIHRNFPFDLIDAEFFFPDGPAAIRLGRAFDVPVSIKARGADIHHWGKNGRTAAQVINAGQTAQGVLAVSGALKADMVALGMPADNIRVHYTGVDLEKFQPINRSAAKAVLDVKGPLIVSVGALIPRKGHHIVIEALASIPDATLVIVGKGEEEANLERLAVELGVADRVRLTGSLPADAIAQWLGAADVMALASASEGLANAWVEALACGTPIVITEAGGARELLTDATGGLICDRNPESFVRAIRTLLANPRDSAEQRQIAERFTWAVNTDALYQHFKGLVA
jgi:teichuronic acid biosynthesis glycosyltransferase TuaC